MGINYYEYIQSSEWRRRADEAKRRAGYRCRVCNRPSTEVTLNAHHRTYERLGHEHQDDITVLCRECHELYEMRKKMPRPPAQQYTQYSTPPLYTSSPAPIPPIIRNTVKQDRPSKELVSSTTPSYNFQPSGAVTTVIVIAIVSAIVMLFFTVVTLSGTHTSPLPTSTVEISTPQPPALEIIQPNAPKGWQKFVSKQTRFSAYLPPKLVPEEQPPVAGNPARATYFAPDSQHINPDYMVISIFYTPHSEIAGHEFAELELKEYIDKWLTQNSIKIITPPDKIKLREYLGFELVHQVTTTDKKYVMRAHCAFISTPDGLYYVEVTGFLDYDNSVQQYYITFMNWFQPEIN